MVIEAEFPRAYPLLVTCRATKCMRVLRKSDAGSVIREHAQIKKAEHFSAKRMPFCRKMLCAKIIMRAQRPALSKFNLQKS
jgi:hypothetical protein